MEGSRRDFGGPKPFQSPRKLHQHKVFFYFSILYERSGSALGRINSIDMLGMLNALPLSLLRDTAENRLIFYLAALNHRHTSILRGELREGL